MNFYRAGKTERTAQILRLRTIIHVRASDPTRSWILAKNAMMVAYTPADF